MGLGTKLRTAADLLKVSRAAHDPWAEYEKRNMERERASVAIANKVVAGTLDPVEAESLLDNMYEEPNPADRAINIDPKVSEALARLVENGIFDPTYAEDILDSGFRAGVIKYALDHVDREA